MQDCRISFKNYGTTFVPDYSNFCHVQNVFKKDYDEPPARQPPPSHSCDHVAFVGHSIFSPSGNVIYRKASIVNANKSSFTVCVGDYVSTGSAIYKVLSIYQSPRGSQLFHGVKFLWGRDTPLLAAADPYEIFLAGCCEQVPLAAVVPSNVVVSTQPNESVGLFWKRKYLESEQCFVTPSQEELSLCASTEPAEVCKYCTKDCVELLDFINDDCLQAYYSTVNVRGTYFSTEDFVMFSSDAWSTPADEEGESSAVAASADYAKRLGDPEMFPELHRKPPPPPQISASQRDNLYKVGQIQDICKGQEGEAFFIVRKFFRPQDIPGLGFHEMAGMPLNELFYTDETVQVPLSRIHKKCNVVFGHNPCAGQSGVFLDHVSTFFYKSRYDIRGHKVKKKEKKKN